MKSLKKDIIIGFIFISIVLITLLFFLYSFLQKVIINQEVSKARLEAKTIYYYRKYLSTVAPYIEVKDKNLSFFACTPAYVTNKAMELLRKDRNFYIKQVSDRFRNPNDKPSTYELEAINYFKTHKNAKEFFSVHIAHKDLNITKKHIFYAYPLWVEKSCLKCHGVPLKDVPANLYDKIVSIYGNRAFNYKLGELRGIISIRIPFSKIEKEINLLFIIFSILLFILFIAGGVYTYFFNKNIKHDLSVLISYFQNLIEKNRYKILKDKMRYKEFEELKYHINNTINKIKKYQVELYKKFNFYDLTNLHNRVNFISSIKKHNKNKIVVLLNIDKFREINSVYGLKIADELIKNVADRLRKLKLKYNFLLYHLDIDEFGLLFEKNISKEKLINILNNLIEELEKPYYVENEEIIIRVRAGVSKEYVNAEVALSQSKDLKKDIVFFEEVKNIKESYEDNLKWLKKLKKAIKEDRIVPFFQPIVDKDKNIIKYEALVRMIDEDGKIISPFFFLDIAKKSRLYNKITKIVIKKSIDKISLKNVSISINLSLEDIENEDTKLFIVKAIDNCKNRNLLTFEIVENEDVRESKEVMEFIKEIKRRDAQVYIDDFGSGYANFDYLLKLSPDGVKIDGSLIKDILTNKNNEIIVKTIVSFAKETNLKTIAEFVENEEIFEKLKSLGVDYFQGYYFSPPKPDIER